MIVGPAELTGLVQGMTAFTNAAAGLRPAVDGNAVGAAS